MRIIQNSNEKWDFQLDADKKGIKEQFFTKTFSDTITLPTTLSEAKKSPKNNTRHSGYLTDPYEFKGYAWFSKEIKVEESTSNYDVFLILERTRITHVWVDDKYIGTENSLSTSHKYNITPFLSKSTHRLTILVDNENYPVSGGHMTSPDTQTNWNGILGEIQLQYLPKSRINSVKIDTDLETKTVFADADFIGENLKAIVYLKDESKTFEKQEVELSHQSPTFTYAPKGDIILWSEHTPQLYTLVIEVFQDGELVDIFTEDFGFRKFSAETKQFTINGEKTFLRGKHDGLIFPLTGYAPMGEEEWLSVLGIAKDYGINHYRFHTCCPPKAAFIAADKLGIYMQPELPFWGTITDENDEEHDENSEKSQKYLIEEGFRILKEFGNHPSFVMMSLGNELWGSKERLNQILADYKAFDSRPLYTEGCNNFQFMPTILEEDDFHVGVRCSRERLFRGSYAMCDAPQGHIQTQSPNSIYDYNEMIRPSSIKKENLTQGGQVEIQFGTGVKTVSAQESDEIIPQIPVISHEVGQYSMYPDYNEIKEYTGVLKAKNFEIFRERLEQAGMLTQAKDFFLSSGRFAAECYKAEVETALRTRELGGFQLLDLQDFTGQGTALVGILNSFMKNKGVISQSNWNYFCSDRVILAKLPTFIFASGENISYDIQLFQYGKTPTKNPKLKTTLSQGETILSANKHDIQGNFHNGLFDLITTKLEIPHLSTPEKLVLTIEVEDIKNQYPLWVYPVVNTEKPEIAALTTDFNSTISALEEGKNILYIAKDIDKFHHIEGTYCTDFWCYPMFRSISETMGKPEPVGTLGLLINHHHPALKHFPTETYSTPQWYDIVTSSSSIILDEIPTFPIVQTIDNVERNHRLALLFEFKIGNSNLLICTADLLKLQNSLPAKQLLHSLVSYVDSAEFQPKESISLDEFKALVK